MKQRFTDTAKELDRALGDRVLRRDEAYFALSDYLQRDKRPLKDVLYENLRTFDIERFRRSNKIGFAFWVIETAQKINENDGLGLQDRGVSARDRLIKAAAWFLVRSRLDMPDSFSSEDRIREAKAALKEIDRYGLKGPHAKKAKLVLDDEQAIADIDGRSSQVRLLIAGNDTEQGPLHHELRSE